MYERFSETDVVVKGEYALSATLTSPENQAEKYPAIVIVSGSGGVDRDGNMKNLQANLYKLLASFLTRLGFVTIRYDKRGIGKSEGDPYTTGMEDLVHDVLSNLKYVQSLPSVCKERILLLGHSEGCILSTIAHARAPVAGLILLAGAGTSLGTAMQWQNRSVAAEIGRLAGMKGAILRKLITEEKVEQKQTKLFNKILASNEDVMRIQLKKFPAKWLREHLKYTDEELLGILKETTSPVLAITGAKDVQADAEALERVNALGNEKILCSVIPNMDHLLREFSGARSILKLKKQYKQSAVQPLHPQLEAQIEAWCSVQGFLDFNKGI